MFKNLDVKKNISRLKYIADQNLGRTEKKELIPEELRNYNERADLIFNSFQNIVKSLTKLCESSGLSLEKLKRYGENRLQLVLKQSFDCLENKESGINSPLNSILENVSHIEGCLATARLDFEKSVENEVIDQFNQVFKDYSSIQKLRSNVKKNQQELDLAENKLATTSKQLIASSSNQAYEKLQPLEEDRNEASNNLEISRNDLAAELYAFNANETKQSQLLIEFVQLQNSYHENCLKSIQNNINKLEVCCSEAGQGHSFGKQLNEQELNSTTKVAYVIEKCCNLIRENDGLREDGILRLAPSHARLKRFKSALEIRNEAEFLSIDVHTVAGALKIFLREIPGSLFVSKNLKKWSEAAYKQDLNSRKHAIKQHLASLPSLNQANIKFLFSFLHDIETHKDENRMNANNIAIVIGPNILRIDMSANSDLVASDDLITSQIGSTITETLLTNFEFFFENEISSTNINSNRPNICPPPPPPKADNYNAVKDMHKDVYSTAFTLNSLGVDTKQYMTQVHAMIDKTTRPATNTSIAETPESFKKKAPLPPSIPIQPNFDHIELGIHHSENINTNNNMMPKRDDESITDKTCEKKLKPPVPDRPTHMRTLSASKAIVVTNSPSTLSPENENQTDINISEQTSL